MSFYILKKKKILRTFNTGFLENWSTPGDRKYSRFYRVHRGTKKKIGTKVIKSMCHLQEKITRTNRFSFL